MRSVYRSEITRIEKPTCGVESSKSKEVMTLNSIVSKSSVGEYLICKSNDEKSNELYEGIYIQQLKASGGKLSKDVNFKKGFSVGSSLQVHGYVEPTADRVAFDFYSKKEMVHVYQRIESPRYCCRVRNEGQNEIENTCENSPTQSSSQKPKQMLNQKPTEKVIRIEKIERNTVTDIGFHFNPRFHEHKVVRNTLQDDVWGQEEVTGGLPLKPGSKFFLRINCEENGYRVFIDEKEFVFYKHRITPDEITGLGIRGAVNLHLVLYKAVIKDEVKKDAEIEEEKKIKEDLHSEFVIQ